MEIKTASYLISSPDVDKCPDVNAHEYAFIGRSNVGKSSLINMLTGRKGLAKTSQTPGKTLLINLFSINNGEWYIVDLPGYGYARRGKSQRNDIRRIIETYILHRLHLTCLFVLLDIRLKPQKIDMEFMRWLGQHQVPFTIIFTKSDKLSHSAGLKNIEAYKKDLLKEWEELPPILITSAEKKHGREELLDFIDHINHTSPLSSDESITANNDAEDQLYETNQEPT